MRLPLAWSLEVEDDVLADATYHRDSRVLEDADDLRRLRLEGLRLFAQPNRFDDVAGDALLQAAGDGFDFR